MAEQNEGDGSDELVPLKAVEDQREAREAAEQARDNARLEAARLQGQIEGQRQAAAAQPAKDAPKEYTAAELQAAVDDERLSPAQAQAIRDEQSARRITKTVTEDLQVASEAASTVAAASAEIGRYLTQIPDLADKSSDAFAKVKGEFNHLVRMGYDADDLRTQATATRIAFGDVAKLEKIGQETARETHQETGGAREPDSEGGAARKDAWPKDMPAKNRRYYQLQIDKGALPDRAAAIAEFSYQPKHSPGYAA